MESLITKEIIINDKIIFNPSSRELKNELTGEIITLHTPGNFCFLHLLANRSRILTKEELIKISWNNEIITDNTFYQMVFNLRQNLAKAGGNNVIVTIPRRGLQINPEISVEILSAGIQAQTMSENAQVDYICLDSDNHVKNRGCKILLMILSGILLLISGLLYISDYEKYAFDDYQQTEYKMCTVHYDEILGKENISALILKSGIDCSRRRSLIVTQSENHSRLSVISCPAGAVNTKNCSLSLYVQ
ncbi:winged helix-turn-helix domain-containing protein [Enterobacter hormaechei]|uniref:winged helix-turn-helix domain-containing protein n=1 Tax=Enterobacter hormaechei TaxID=158836 RepID=UPI00188CBAB0|nr:winged helix-turn-helix domain-containing protein [Enterobacter hormaechei]MBF4154936.1 winged helix-turn-helix domain-containing protein [Enterobacter hormaechei]